jgi:stage V sporulation protein K
MIFTGNPGTGKTTVARLMGRLFKAVNLLPRGHLVEVSRVDLVGQHVGETAVKTQGVVERATGGVLFVDEAYTLVSDSKDSFGREALESVVKCMEDMREVSFAYTVGLFCVCSWALLLV